MNEENKEKANVAVIATIAIIFALLLLLSGCASQPALEDDDLNAEQKLQLYTKMLDATLEDGSDERCWTVMSVEIFCRKRVRDVNVESDNG